MKILLLCQCLGQFVYMTLTNYSSVSLFEQDKTGFYSSYFQLAQYLGIILVGFFGGKIIIKFKPQNFMRMLLFFLYFNIVTIYFLDHVSIYLFFGGFLSFIDALSHPNYLRCYYDNLKNDEIKKFFSWQQFIWQCINITTYYLLPKIYKIFSKEQVILMAIAILVLIFFLWPEIKLKEKKETSSFEGYQVLVKNEDVRGMTLHRLMNQIIFGFFYIGLPVLLAPYAQEGESYAHYYSTFYIFFSIGFLFLALSQNFYFFNKKVVGFFSKLLSFSLFFCFVGIFFPHLIKILPLLGLFLGISQFCQRMLIILLGREFTPRESLTSVIIAGDTISRISSVLVGRLSLFLIKQSFFLKLGFLVIPLLSPIFLKKLLVKTKH